ncbi:uncharacterized protein LOC132272898 [Cornus florida]|uniref:uncharacterized protein LOC132272898 n=1 Tax=Cornus florida TaxID=4283 RepID=UPI00289C5E34|nr:uncharacterized protein LOC132272898 [Cornus florida]
MVRLRSGLVAGEYEALQTSDQRDSTRQPPAVSNDQERVTALQQYMQDLRTRVKDVMQAMKGKGQATVNDLVEDVDDKVALTAFMGGLQTFKFLFFLSKEAPTSMTELMVRAWKHMNARKNKNGEDKRSEKKRPAPNTREEKESKYKKFSNNQADRSSHRPVSPGRRLFQPQNQIENLVHKGHLRKFTTRNGKGGSNPAWEGRDDRPPQHQPMGEIKVISGGFAGGGETSSARKAHARRIRNFSKVNEVGMTSPPTKLPRVEESVITFSEEDDKGIHQPHDDPLVVSMVVANFTVRRILIDNGSSADILFLRAYEKLKIGREKLRPMKSPLVGFSGDKVYPLGAVTLPVTAGANPKQVTVMVDFVVVDCPSSYNFILGRTTLNTMKAITSTYHLLMRFPTEYGMGELRGDQTIARECYVASLRKQNCKRHLRLKGWKGKIDQTFIERNLQKS